MKSSGVLQAAIGLGLETMEALESRGSTQQTITRQGDDGEVLNTGQ